MIKPHDLFNYRRADEVAECMEGVTEALYSTLWSDIVPHQSEEFQETPEAGFEALANHWRLLSEEDQLLLNAIAEKNDY
jgi:predicted transcriptional regulator